MIPSDSAGGGYTAWEGYDIEAIHNLVQSVTDDQIETSWQQVTAWRKTQELLDNHAGTLSVYRQGLVNHWPPEKNAASAAFVKYVDELILSLQQASKAADDNVRGLSDLTLGVSTARTEVKKAYQEYAANQTKLNTSQNQAKPIPTGRPMPMPSPAPPPIAPGRQEQLTKQARQAMATLSGTAMDSTWRMTVPPPYTPPRTGVIERTQHIDAPSAVTTPPPLVPAPRTSASRFGATASPIPGGTDSGSHRSGPDLGALPGGNAPILTGGALTPPAPIVTPTPPVNGPIPSPPGGVLPPGGIILPPSVGGGKLPPNESVGARGGPLGGASHGSTGAMSGVTEGRSVGGTRALAPGGVIGGAPVTSTAHAVAGGGRPSAGAASWVNPVGGVLGQGSPPGAHASGPAGGRGTTGSTTTGQPFLAGQRAGKANRDRHSRRWDPDDPWAVEHGVAPVLEPGQERSFHDPGPGVIGIDR